MSGESLKSAGLGRRIRFALLGGGLRVLARSINKARSKDPWLDRALNQFEGVWRFESGDKKLAEHLILAGGRLRVSKDAPHPPNFTITLIRPGDLSARRGAADAVEVVIADKIGQNGDLYYLYQFGFIMSLWRRTTRFKGKSLPIEGS